MALALAGCGTQTVDPKSGEALVRKGIAIAHSPTPRSVSCPSGVQAKAGTTFECHATLANGRTATFTIRVDSVSGSHGHLTIVGIRQP